MQERKGGLLKGRLPPMGGRALKYGYSNARVRAMKGLILKQAFLDEMIRVGNVEAMAELLQRTGYKAEISAASASYRGSELIEMASSRNFSRTVRKLVKITPDSDRDALKALLVRWDLMNLKTLLNARRLGKSYDDIKPRLFDIGGLDEEDFKRILQADNNALLREIQRTDVGRRLWEMTPDIERGLRGAGQDIAARLDAAVDSYVYIFMDRTLAAVGGNEVSRIREILRREADARNAMVIERLKRHGTAAEKIRRSLILGGTMNDQMLNRLIEAKDLQSSVNILRAKFPQMEIKGEGRGALTELEIALEKSIAIQKTRAFQKSVLSAGVLIGFMLLKEEELNNLRKIAKGKEFHMSEADVRAMLVVV